MKVVIRVDSSAELGMGHLIRCLTLAKEIGQHGADVEFICQDLPGEQSKLLEEQGQSVRRFRRVITAEEDARATLSVMSGPPADWVIVDHYRLDASWEKMFRQGQTRVMVIDDLADRPHDCDLLLDQNYNPDEPARYSQLVPEDCTLLLGPTFALVGQAYESNRGRRPDYSRNVVIAFGGSDPPVETLTAIEAMRVLSSFQVDVVVGAANRHREEIKKKCCTFSGFHFHMQVPNLAELLGKADLAIGAGGSSTWERCCLGVPSIIISIADNQAQSAAKLGRDGYAIYLGKASDVEIEAIVSAVREIHERPDLRDSLSRRSMQLVDGRGRYRVTERLLMSSHSAELAHHVKQ